MINNTFDGSIIDVIKLRRSIRSYKDEELSGEVILKLNEFMKNKENPFGVSLRFKLISMNNTENIKLGTYGVIRGAKAFLAVACEECDFNFEALGYKFEEIVLYATSLGLGTCWLGGTFNKGAFAKAIDLKENEILPIVSPVGYSNETQGTLDSIIKLVTKSDKRKAFEEIFYYRNFETKLTKEEAGKYGTILEMIRLAPSAKNKQPWRVIKDNNILHFYNIEPNSIMHRVDLGIALCHLKLTADELGIKGCFKKLDNIKETIKENSYVISWIEQ